MAAARVVFHPGASEDYANAFAWYYERGTTLASDFESEINRGIRLISQNPRRSMTKAEPHRSQISVFDHL